MNTQHLFLETSGQVAPKLNAANLERNNLMSTTTQKEINGTTYKVTANYTGQLNLADLLRNIIKKEIQKS